MTAYARLGGEAVLRPLVQDFVERMLRDPMIGFFFMGVDSARLVEREFELTARFLGAELPYSGRPIREAHARHRIMGGQFDRRTQLLREVFADYDVPADVRQEWLAHVESLRTQVTKDGPGECQEPSN